ncbi:MAG: hypothetical protein QM730_16675 [Anaerolineales bacterium]
MMKRYDPRLWIGVALVLGGILALLDTLGIISNAGGIFWGVVWGIAAAIFLYMLFTNPESWWAAFPGFTFLGLSLSSFLPESLSNVDGLVFFAGIAAAFWWVYFVDTSAHWWAIIPGGVLLTLGLVSALEDASGMDSGGLFFLGLGLTFILVALLPGGRTRSWALIPGSILLVFGAIIGTAMGNLTDYIWPAVLIILGGFFVLRFFRNPSSQ